MMSTATATKTDDKIRFDVVPAQAALGAEVRNFDLRTLDDASFSALHRLWPIICCSCFAIRSSPRRTW